MLNEKEVQFVKGNDSQQDEFIDFINYVFHMNGTDSDFYRALPKLYKKEFHPCRYNYLALEDGHIKAAVGAFPGEVTVCNLKLTYQGIGNVAVNPYSRSKGYMKKLMNQAVDHMIMDDVDFSMLGGRRQRYAYFSYEIVGRSYSFWLDESNIKHSYQTNNKERFQFLLVEKEDKEALKDISNLQKRQPLSYNREDYKLYDILKNWTTVDIYGIYEDNSFKGYLLCYDKKTLKEIILEKQEDITQVVAEFIKTVAKGGMTIVIPEYQRYFIDAITPIAENISMNNKENFSVFHYDRVIEAFLTLKAQTDKVADGRLVILIHGKRCDESLLISVNDGKVQVLQTKQKAEYEYSHIEAMNVLFGNYSPLRSKLSMEIQTWLPLPIGIFPADEV